MSTHWDYGLENGPAQWPKFYPQAAGKRQSPVNINTKRTRRESNIAPLVWSYVAEQAKSLNNSGHGWRVDVTGNKSTLSGGPLGNNTYILAQFHCHWGCSDIEGSEHTVDDNAYAGELHLVHWNATKYKHFNEALHAPDGLAVLGVFLKPGQHHAEMEKITNLLHLIAYKGDRVTLPHGGCDVDKFLPRNSAYWSYEGSLTTPPCLESVIWLVFQTPIEVSSKQLKAMRQLNCHDVKEELEHSELEGAGKLEQNFRPTLPLGEREIVEVAEIA